MQVAIKHSSLVLSQTLAASVAQPLFNCISQPSSLHNPYSASGFELSTRQPFPFKRKLCWVERTICNGKHALPIVLGHTAPSVTPIESIQTGFNWRKGLDSGRKARTHEHSIIQHYIPLTFWRTSSLRMVTSLHTCIPFLLWPTQAHAAESRMGEMARSWWTQRIAHCLRQGCQHVSHVVS